MCFIGLLVLEEMMLYSLPFLDIQTLVHHPKCYQMTLCACHASLSIEPPMLPQHNFMPFIVDLVVLSSISSMVAIS